MGFLKSINSLFMCLLASAQLQQLTLLSSFRLSTEPVGTKENGSEIMVEQMADQTESLPRDSQSTPVINMTKLQLSTYLVDNAPTTEARFLLDFVIAGFPQCGTTTLGTWLGNHPEIQVQPGENHHHGFPVDQMVRSLFRNLKEHHKDPFQVKKGFSSPHYIQSERGNMVLQEYFPNTKIIISVRHPVLWFESYYNYRLQQKEFSILKGTPNELIGELDCNGCQNSWILSTAKGRFHRYLARLLKTPLSDPTEMQLLGVPHRRDKLPLKQLSKTKNPVFFMELTQLGDTDEVRSGQFRHDLQTFLGLETEFPVESLPHVHPGNVGHPTRHSRPGKVVHQRKESHRGKKVQQHQARNSHPGKKVQQHHARNSHPGNKVQQHHAMNSHPGKKLQHQARNNSTIDICNDEYFPVRQDLMDISRNASLWFRNYFLASDEVFVSSRDYLDQILEGWMIDPCQERSMSQQ